MPTKVQTYAQMAEDTARLLTGSYQEWTAFLTTAARNYKYPYPEQLMIYAQRPEATACAGYDFWNKRTGRYVRRGSTGIALLDMAGDKPALRYVFDVSDTDGREKARPFKLWEYRPEHEQAVSAMLKRQYDIAGTGDLAEQMEKVAAQLADEYWMSHQRDILSIVDDSFLYGYDDFNVGVAFRSAATVSITYSLMVRCGLEPENYFEHEDFLSIFDWNTPEAVAELGTAVSIINQEVLRQIERTVKQYEREHSAERMAQHEKQPDLQPERGLSDPQPDSERAAGGEHQQVRADAEEISAREQAGPIQPPAPVGKAASTPCRDRPDGAPEIGADAPGAGESSGGDGGVESPRPAEMGGLDEQLQGPGGGDHSGRAGLQLTSPAAVEQISLFPTEAQQITWIKEAESVQNAPFAFSVSDEELAHILRLGGNTEENRRKVAAEFSKQKPLEELAAFLQKNYHGGNGFHFESGDMTAWYAGDGIHLARGSAARYVASAQIISWTDAAERISAMLSEGSFASNVELAEAPGYERREIAQSLLYLYHDLSEEAHDAGTLSVLDNLRDGGYPEATERVAAFLEDRDNRAALLASYEAFLAAYRENRNVLRFHYHRPLELAERLRELDLPRAAYQSEMAEVPSVGQFITEDEIAETLSGGSSMEGGKGRIFAFFQERHTPKEQTDFLKDEYGIGGRSHALSGASGSSEDHGGEGIRLRKQDCMDVELAWSNVAKRITALIRENRYLTEAEQEQAQKRQQENTTEQPQPTVENLLEQYKPIVAAAISEDTAYRNACGHSDRENAVIEGNAAVRRAVLNSHDMQLIRVYSDMPDFRHRLHQEVIDETQPWLHELLRPLTQDDIDEALRAWNGEIASKQAVVRYMEHHARDKDTAAWLANEYSGGNGSKSLFVGRAGSPEQIEMPWEKVQRRIAQLVQQDAFYTDEERDNLDDIDPVAIREHLESNQPNPFVEQVMADAEQIAEENPSAGAQEEQSAVVGNTPTSFIYEGFHFAPVGVLGEDFDANETVRHTVSNNALGMSSYDNARRAYTHAAFYEAAGNTRADVFRCLETGKLYLPGSNELFEYNGTFQLYQEKAQITEPAENAPEAKKLTDLQKKAIEIAKSYDGLSMQGKIAVIAQAFGAKPGKIETSPCYGKWRGTSDIYIRFDNGNRHFIGNRSTPKAKTVKAQSELVDAVLVRYNPEIIAITKETALAALRKREAIDNAIAAQKELKPYTLLNVEFNDGTDAKSGGYQGWYYVTLAIDGEIHAHMDSDLNHGIANGAVSEIPVKEQYHIAGALKEDQVDYVFYNVGFSSASMQYSLPISSEVLERAKKTLAERIAGGQQERSASEAAHDTPSIRTETVAVYPAEQSRLPYDIGIQTLHFDEPERTAAPEELSDWDDADDLTDEELAQLPTSVEINGEWHTFPNEEAALDALEAAKPTALQAAPQNYRITDDNLGAGGAKTKFHRNMDAITLLKSLEAEGRQATAEEQETLSQYVGWGGLADAFDEGKDGWTREYQELKAALTPEEYAAACASTLNAHYTSPTVIKAIYEAVGNMGFQSGNILEPSMGVGNFFGLLPDNMAGSKLYGVELDSITGRIARQLYPNADITVAGFETTDRRDFFDLAVGNVPFGDYKVNDRAYNRLNFSIHNYFFAKALDQVRPGGVVAFVTSRFTMDAKDPTVRKYLAKRADLLGAIRLPNNAFKENAGTEVVSDIIFLQKRDRPIEIEPDWVHLGLTGENIPINAYFAEHPEMVLGTFSMESTQYGRDDVTVRPIPGMVLADQLHEAIQHIRGTYQEVELPELGEDEVIQESIPADPDVKNYSYTLVDGEVYYRENSVMVKPDLNATAKERVKGMIELRDCVQTLIGQQMDGFVSDAAIQNTQTELNRLYDSFTAKYGLINSRANSLAFSDDSSYFLLCSLEELDEDKNLKRKADLFTKRTIRPHEAVTAVDTASEALALSISEKARVDMDYMMQLTGKSEQELFSELRGVIFLNPMHGYGRAREEKYVTADEYLSGNVREKLAWARRSAEQYPEDYAANVEALEKAQPKDLDASEIDVRLGATWIDKEYIQQFLEETFEPPYYALRNIQVNFSSYTAEWNITGKSAVNANDINAYMTYGTERANAYKILEDTLNLRDVRVYDTVRDAEGKEKRVLNSKETTLAQQKQQAIKEAFSEWVWRDPERRQTLVTKYNELFNADRPREYDGQHIVFSGMNPEIQLREHQKNAVAHILYGGNTLLAHQVGAGKTFEMAAAAMESKRLGLCSKSLFAVPNHLTEQWASEFLRLYPSANILVATKKDFEPHNRKKFCARIATGDYDAVIIGHSQFERIPVSVERQERLLKEQIKEITDGIAELKESRGERFNIKQLEKTRKNLEAKLEKLQDDGRKDDVVTFEQLGVDRLFVDEAHSYKNLFLYTKMRNVAGLSTSDAQKSSDMLLKCRYLDEITGGKGVVFATGTPVSNSMTELYTMMRYLQHDMLKRKNLTHFDAWASTFGETTTAIELAPEGYTLVGR